MSAGLPGLGLGGLFFIVSALLAPVGQLWRTVRGRGRPGQWRLVWRQFFQAAAMVIGIDLTVRLVYLPIDGASSVLSVSALPLTPIAITSGLLVTVLCVAKLAQLRQRAAKPARPRFSRRLPAGARPEPSPTD